MIDFTESVCLKIQDIGKRLATTWEIRAFLLTEGLRRKSAGPGFAAGAFKGYEAVEVANGSSRSAGGDVVRVLIKGGR